MKWVISPKINKKNSVPAKRMNGHFSGVAPILKQIAVITAKR